MTIRTKRRGRTLAAILVTMLMASVLAVVAGAPSQAANTSGEELWDHDGDASTPKIREFAGSHRYNTAVALAERFARDEGSISTVIIASGESEVDAVTASGLAGNLNAPVLLTRSSRLPHNVARFIDEQNVTDVVIVGGTAAVSDDVVTALESLGSRPSVDRVSGADRYATAAAIGGELGGPNPTWCGSDQSAAILVNGGADGRADAIAIGPMAFRLGLPMLLTAADEVPEATAAFLTDNKVERVVVVGGMGAVSGDVVDALVEDIGVVNVQRISGGSAAGTSVAVAKEMLGNCAEVLQTNKDLVALVNRDATADGIAAAPVLGRGLGVAGSVPVMLVGDELPAAVSDYLAATVEWRAGFGKTHQSIVAIGGTAVVSESVMAEAVAAAKTSSDLTATITPIKYTATTLAQARDTTLTGTAAHPCAASVPASAGVGSYTCQFRVTFSDDVRLATDTDEGGSIEDDERVGTVEDPTMYRINGRRIAAGEAATASEEPVSLLDLVFTADRTVTLTLTHHLEAGDKIAVDNSANEAKGSRLGLAGTNAPAGNDLRKLEPAEMTLPAVTLAADRNAPVVQIVAVPGTAAFDILVTERNLLHNEINAENLDDFVSVTGHSRNATRKSTGITVAVGSVDNALTAPAKVNGRATVTHRYRITTTPGLERGDVITIERKAFLDRGGRGSPLVRHTVPRVKTNTPGPTGTGNLEIQSVSIGNVMHGNANGTGHAAATILTDSLRVSAKATGVASGARGNGWRIFGYDDRAGAEGSTNAFVITTAVDIANQRISYTIEDALPIRPGRAAQIGDLAKELASNPDFAANFSLGYVNTDDAKTDPLGATTATGVGFTGGISKVGVVVKFNNPIASLTGTDLAGDIAPRFPASPADPDVLTVSLLAPDTEVHISYTSDSMAELPTRAGFRVIAAGVATGYADATDSPAVSTAVTNIREILNSLRPDASIRP